MIGNQVLLQVFRRTIRWICSHKAVNLLRTELAPSVRSAGFASAMGFMSFDQYSAPLLLHVANTGPHESVSLLSLPSTPLLIEFRFFLPITTRDVVLECSGTGIPWTVKIIVRKGDSNMQRQHTSMSRNVKEDYSDCDEREHRSHKISILIILEDIS